MALISFIALALIRDFDFLNRVIGEFLSIRNLIVGWGWGSGSFVF